MRVWKDEHPGAEVPAWFPSNCDDISWKGDPCPRFVHGDYAVWVDFINPDRRDRVCVGLPRYRIHRIWPTEEGKAAGRMDCASSYETDDLFAATAWLERAANVRAAG